MQDIMPPVDTVDNLFHDGNPVTGEQGTIVSAEFLNNLQGATRDTQTELKSILTAAGIAVDPDKQNQVLTALSKLYLSRVNPGADIAADGAAAIATFLANLGLGEAAKRNVGTGANQIPDMSLFASSNTATAAAQKFPSGLILQCGMLNSPPNASSTYGMTFPMTFSRVLAVVVTLNVTGASGQPTVSATNIHNTGFDITVSPGSVYGASSDAYYIAMGY